jgi:hypothetical protein
MYRDPDSDTPFAQARIMPFPWERRADRHEVDLLVRYAWNGLRATVLLKDLTCFGTRIEGIEGLRSGDGLTLLLPGLPATHATVAWATGRAAGLTFETAIPAPALDTLVRDFATPQSAPFPRAPARMVRVA